MTDGENQRLGAYVETSAGGERVRADVPDHPCAVWNRARALPPWTRTQEPCSPRPQRQSIRAPTPSTRSAAPGPWQEASCTSSRPASVPWRSIALERRSCSDRPVDRRRPPRLTGPRPCWKTSARDSRSTTAAREGSCMLKSSRRRTRRPGCRGHSPIGKEEHRRQKACRPSRCRRSPRCGRASSGCRVELPVLSPRSFSRPFIR